MDPNKPSWRNKVPVTYIEQALFLDSRLILKSTLAMRSSTEVLCPEIRLLKKATTLTPDNMWARGPTLPAYQIIGITHESNQSKLNLCTCTRIVNSFKINSVSLVGKCRGHAHLLSVQNKLTRWQPSLKPLPRFLCWGITCSASCPSTVRKR